MTSDSAVTTTVSVRALASRRNGARSRGPSTAAGKARSARNALRHGLCAQKFLLLPQEDAGAFAALEQALLEELAPVGALQAVLAGRVISAAWRLMRADRMEAEALAYRSYSDASAGLAVIRDGNGTRSFDSLMRYRAAAETQLQRALATLQALQAKAAAERTAPPARRRGPRPGAQRNEPTEGRQISRLTAGRTAEPPPDAPARHQRNPVPPPTTPSETTPTRKVTPSRRLALPARGRSPGQARDRDGSNEAAPGSPVAIAKQTRGSGPKQGLGVQATC